jgi:DNA-binding beta-propeller fold protein YncE
MSANQVRVSWVCWLIGSVLLLVMSCARAQGAATPQLQWPPAPAQARVAFGYSLQSSVDAGVQRGWLTRVTDWLFGEEELRLQRPSAVVRQGGVLYVADLGHKGVHRLDAARSRHDLVRGPDGMLLPSPVGLAAGPGQQVLIADSALGQIFILGPQDAQAQVLPLTRPVRQPTGIAYSSAREEIAVVDTAAHQIQVYSTKGEWLRTVGKRGKEEAEFNYPTYIALAPNGQWVVTDALNFRIQVLAPDGTFVRMFGRQGDGSGDFGRHKGVAVDAQGHLYVVDGLFSAIQVFDLQGQFLLALGSLGRAEGEFWLPMGVSIDGTHLYVADSANQRVQVFRLLEALP